MLVIISFAGSIIINHGEGKNALVQAAHRPLVNCRLKMLSVGKEHVFCFLLSELRPAKNDRSKDTDPDFLQIYI